MNSGFYNSVQEWIQAEMPLNSFVCGNCMQGMAAMPDKFVNLAIVDPQYGIDCEHMGGRGGKSTWKDHKRKNWDLDPPPEEYFIELNKVSENRIIWGANYFSRFLDSSMGWIFWDKRKYTFSASDGELAYSSFKCKLRVFSRYVNEDKGIRNKDGGDIHSCQKPTALYRWLLKNYAKSGDIILDTHVGSASSLIACEQMGFQYIGFEIDADYYQAACKRILQARELLKQQDIFAPDKSNGKEVVETMKLDF